ncbi:hypothetical protein ON010_g9882 [Phytophthora cinnamomi]|nr:hypothetical protein ON010_g9882 [Phytophthora cinnamomi]
MAPAWPIRRPGGAVPLGRLLLGGSADLAHHDDALGLGVVGEALEAVDEVGAVERVAANADDGGLAEAQGRGLGHGLVGQGARAGHDADLALLVDVAGHDAHLALTGLDDAGAVGADEARLVLVAQVPLDLDHVLLRDALGDGHDQRDLGLDGLNDRRGAERRRHVDDRRVGARLLLGLCHRVEHGQAQILLGIFARRYLLAGEALADDLGVLVDPHLGGRRHAARGLGGHGLHGRAGEHGAGAGA